jgi:hypothetical protein
MVCQGMTSILLIPKMETTVKHWYSSVQCKSNEWNPTHSSQSISNTNIQKKRKGGYIMEGNDSDFVENWIVGADSY